MTQEDKDLLIKDICVRLPYGVICNDSRHGDSRITEINVVDETVYCDDFDEYVELDKIKPYLRPMSSMTKKERDEFEDESNYWFYVNEDGEIYPMGRLTDADQFECGILSGLRYLLKNHFDYHDLIPKGLALVAPDDMYK